MRDLGKGCKARTEYVVASIYSDGVALSPANTRVDSEVAVKPPTVFVGSQRVA